MHILYSFLCPIAGIDSKVGRTSHPLVRLGVYQNSYSSRSRLARFDIAYHGTESAVLKLEKRIKVELDWDIELDGAGKSEWVCNHTPEQIKVKIDKIISGNHFKVTEVNKEFLPITAENYELFKKSIKNT